MDTFRNCGSQLSPFDLCDGFWLSKIHVVAATAIFRYRICPVRRLELNKVDFGSNQSYSRLDLE